MSVTTKRQEEWFNGANGRAMNPDNTYGRQCKDVADDYCIYLFGDWVSTIRPGNANVAFNNSNGDFFEKIANNANDPNLIPRRGDILCYGGWAGNSAGHILVIESADTNGYTGIEQDGFTVRYDSAGRVINQGVPAYRVTRSYAWNFGSLQGWLRPKHNRIIGGAPEPTPLLDFQRLISADLGGVVRSAPNTASTIIETYPKGSVVDFSGYVKGQNVNGTDIWFKGKYRDVYMSASIFSDQTTRGLTDLTPKAEPTKPATNERVVIDGGLNVRQAPNTSSAIIKVLLPNEKVVVNGFVRGESVDGNDVWYEIADGLIWSGGTNSKATSGLKDLTPSAPTVPVEPAPEPPKYIFSKELSVVTNVIPAAIGNFAYDNMPENVSGIVLHDFGLANVNTYGSVISTFTNGNNQVSSHLVFSRDKAVQMVSLKDRAYHAKSGNDLWGFELDPAYIDDPLQIANVRQAISELQKKEGKKLTLHKHPEFVNTTCGDDIDLSVYDVPYIIDEPTEPVEPTPDPEPPKEPETPDEPIEPAPTDEAAKSATAFVTRVASQLAASAIAVNGLAVLITQYTTYEIPSNILGILTVLVTFVIIAYGQYRYKKSGGEKGWFF